MILGISACVKQPSYSVIPELTAVTMSKTVIYPNVEYDTIAVSLAFTDGDGDVGINTGGNTDSLAFTPCTDHSFDSTVIADPYYDVFWYEYHARSISTDSCISYAATPLLPYTKGIKGLILVYPKADCPPTGTMDTVYYSFFIKDRAGHLSNRLRTPPVLVNCQ